MSNNSGFEVGDAAEDAFKAWCSQAKIIASPPAKDRGGWDFHLNLPQSDRIDPIEAPPALACYVQVKGHMGGDPSPPAIKLSNWQRMISEVMPWFVVVVLFNREAEAQRAFLIHVDEGWVNKARKRIWENAAGEKRPLHDLTMGCTWTEDQSLPSLHGREILAALRLQIGDAKGYIKAKQAWYENAGVDKARHSCRMSWGPEVSEQDLCDFALGKRKSLGVTEVQTADVRFGIPIHRDTLKRVDIQFPTSPSIGLTQVRIRSSAPPRDTVDITFATLLSTSIFPFLSPEYQRIRLVAPVLSAEVYRRETGGTTLLWNFHVDESEAVSLSDLDRAARAARALLISPPAEIEVFLPPQGRRIVILAPNASERMVEPLLHELVEAACNAGCVARVFGLNLDETVVTPESLMNGADALKSLASLYSGSSLSVSLNVHNVGPQVAQYEGKKMARVFVLGAYVGRYCLLQCAKIHGVGHVTPDGVSLSLVEPQLQAVERFVVDKEKMTEEDANARLAAMVKRGQEEEEGEGYLIIEDPAAGTSSATRS